MRANEYAVLEQAVETGVNLGWTRAHKHNSDPTENAIKDAIYSAVLSEICEWFRFEDTEEKDP